MQGVVFIYDAGRCLCMQGALYMYESEQEVAYIQRRVLVYAGDFLYMQTGAYIYAGDACICEGCLYTRASACMCREGLCVQGNACTCMARLCMQKAACIRRCALVHVGG